MKIANYSTLEYIELNEEKISFNEHETLHDLKHFLPAQAPLKDFIHHNTLHAFQDLKFYKAIHKASEIFGYRVSLSLEEYRSLYNAKIIRKDILDKVISDRKGPEGIMEWKKKLILNRYKKNLSPRIGKLRANWKTQYHIDLDSHVHPILFRIICSYLDQGISIWNFPAWENGFLSSIKEIEKKSFTSFLKTKRARALLFGNECTINGLLKILVGDESLYKQYLFDQQFAHPGWSGMASFIEENPQALLDTRKISLHDVIVFELLLEIDALEFQFGKKWSPLKNKLKNKPIDLFAEVYETELWEVISLWQNAYEWSYYDDVLAGIKMKQNEKLITLNKTFQAIFCIDDREGSLRDYLEKLDPSCETFATPGFFNVEFFFQPEQGKFYTKQCPAPIQPKYLIKEFGVKEHREKDFHFTKQTHLLFRGWLISQTWGFWSAIKLFLNIFRPSLSPASSSSFRHMDKYSSLSVENTNINHQENSLQIGFTVEEMACRVEGLLKSIGLVKDFAPIVYVVGHGASSANNPHYAGYDCGACSGRPGSVNAKVFSFMANHPKVREALALKGLVISEETQFVGALHDTTRDEICYYDESLLSANNHSIHKINQGVFNRALSDNSKERSRRFASIDTRLDSEIIHDKIRKRSVSLFEPRPELNHATNAVCVIGRRNLTKNIFLDRRSFMNSYDYRIDPEGEHLYTILKAAAPVCGGINLEYYFSRIDNEKLGAGTKLPHNVMGLFGVANGTDGDLRTGLPSQMIEIHDPIRLLIIVEQFEDTVLKAITKSDVTYEWFINEWVHLVVIHPETKKLSVFKDGMFSDYCPLNKKARSISDIKPLIESYQDNIPVHLIS